MPAFTKGKWLIHEGYFDGITLNPKQYYIYPDSGEPYTDDFIVCAEEADARLIAAAPDMYNFIRTLYELLNIPAARQILERIDGKKGGEA